MAGNVEGRRIVPRREPLAVVEARELGLAPGMWGVVVFLASEVMFFAALFTAYFYLRAQNPAWAPPEGERPGVWPFRGPITEAIPTINTLILVSSSFMLQWGVNHLRRGDRHGFIVRLVATMVMGVVFLSGQAFEYWRLFGGGVTPRSALFGGVFFGLTGFHGAHVTAGVLFMLVVLLRALRGQFSARRHLAVEAATLYWHFVDVVWLGLYTTLYIL